MFTHDFPLSLLVHSDRAVRDGVSNIPGTQETENLIRLSGILNLIEDWLLERYPIIRFHISSAFRSAVLNSLVGGSATSLHKFGLAVDLTASGFTPLQLAQLFKQACEALNIDYEEIIHEFGAWVHFALPHPGMSGKKENLSAVKVKGSVPGAKSKTTYLKGFV